MVHYVTIFQSELQAICAIAAAFGRIETGGMCFGAWSRGGRPIIFFITGPGPNALHQLSYFRQDIDFFRRTIRWIEDTYGVQYIGDWHSHHFQASGCPSHGDLEQVASLTRKNNFTRWMGFIVTLKEPESRNPSNCGSHPSDPEVMKASLTANLDAYLYETPTEPTTHACPIRVLPGTSPLRLAILAADRQELAGVQNLLPAFPLHRIAYDPFKSDQSPSPATEVPQTLIRQLQRLATIGLTEPARLTAEKRVVTITLPLVVGCTVDIAVDRAPPHVVRKVLAHHIDEGDEVDLTSVVVPPDDTARLPGVYKRLMSAVDNWDRKRPSASDGVTLLERLQEHISRVLGAQ
jgi:hypothetical protein